jgi:hypothetical protein
MGRGSAQLRKTLVVKTIGKLGPELQREVEKQLRSFLEL